MKDRGLASALSMAWELGYTIALPIIIFAIGGRLLDKKLESSPWFLLAGIGVALMISGTAVYYKTVKIISEAEQKDKPGFPPSAPEAHPPLEERE